MFRFSIATAGISPLLSIAFVLSLAAGCGQGRYTPIPAKGKVVCNGQPVTMGSVSFVPIAEAGDSEPGKPASGSLGPDGTFTLTTNDRFDGAIVGKHNVRYFGPEGEDEEEGDTSSMEEGSAEEKAANAAKAKEKREMLKSLCVQTTDIVVEVTADGENDFTIELSPASAARSGRGGAGGYVEGSSGD